jgi:hypothetical protein
LAEDADRDSRRRRVLPRSFSRSRTADLCLPGLWCADDHHRDLGVRTTDPCAAITARCCMTVSASRSQNRASYRNRPVPIPAAFVPSHHNVHFCVRGAQVISSMRPATDHFGNGIACITNVTDASCPPAPIQIPIALRINPATAQRPAVSSPEACPTPAIQVMRVPIRPRPTAGIRQPLTRAVILRTVSNNSVERSRHRAVDALGGRRPLAELAKTLICLVKGLGN